MAALTDVAIAQAMVANGRWSARLGWDRYVDAIDVLLGAAPGTPAAAAVFSSALADWQAAHQLDVDGILGPETWAAMRRALAERIALAEHGRAGAVWREANEALGVRSHFIRLKGEINVAVNIAAKSVRVPHVNLGR